MKKFQFAKQNVKFCRVITGSGTRRPDPEKVLAIKEIVVPDTKKQLRGILGLFSYFRKYVPAIAAKAKVLTDLTSKRAPQNLKLQWTEQHTQALETLKQELTAKDHCTQCSLIDHFTYMSMVPRMPAGV